MRWLVAGAKGMLGRDAVDVLGQRGHEATGVDLPELDVTDPEQVGGAVAG